MRRTDARLPLDLPDGVTAVLLDYCGVLAHPMNDRDVQALATLAGVPPASFVRAYWQDRRAYDLAEMTATAYWQGVARAGGFAWSAPLEGELIALDAEVNTRVCPEAAAWVRQAARQGLSLGLLSNLPEELRQWVAGQAEWRGHFRFMLFSCEIGVVKPELRAFGLALERLGSRPEQTLFVDDREENLAVARRLGLHTRSHLSSRSRSSCPEEERPSANEVVD